MKMSSLIYASFKALLLGLLVLPSCRALEPNPNDPSSSPSDAYKPNIIFIVVDDLGAGDLGRRGSGIDSPTMNVLAKYGVQLKDYYVHPVCSPTRIALLTGRYPYRSDIYMAVEPKENVHMSLDEETLAQVNPEA